EQIAQILKLSGAPALSLGVFHEGKVVHKAHFGRRECTKPDAPNDESIYFSGSMLKILTVSTISKLAYDGVLGWDVRIREYLPDFNRDDDVGRLATLRDLIANTTGLTGGVFYWSQQNGELLQKKNELLRMACHIEAVKPFRTGFLYSQWNYVLVHLVIEAVTKKPFSEVVHSTMIQPLGLKNTTFAIPHGPNTISPHGAREDGSAIKIKINPWTDESGMTAGAGGKASLNDLLTVYSKLLHSYNDQLAHNRDTTPESPFVGLRAVFEPQVKARTAKSNNQEYCLGLYKTSLPGNLSISSWNSPLFGEKTPAFGNTLQGVEVFHHTLGIPGFLGSMFLVPKSSSGVVVLTNATPLLDASDLVAQGLLGVLLGEPLPYLLKMANTAPKISSAIFRFIASSLEEDKTDTPPSLPLASYAGIYYNSSKTFSLHVSSLEKGLRISVQGNPRVTYDLEMFDGDTFCLPVKRDEEYGEKGMWPQLLPSFRRVEFEVDKKSVRCLTWHHD
ncbi:beta-lactamase/transpeptidase-like protein, partial [Periconia macrospinosa]